MKLCTQCRHYFKVKALSEIDHTRYFCDPLNTVKGPPYDCKKLFRCHSNNVCIFYSPKRFPLELPFKRLFKKLTHDDVCIFNRDTLYNEIITGKAFPLNRITRKMKKYNICSSMLSAPVFYGVARNLDLTELLSELLRSNIIKEVAYDCFIKNNMKSDSFYRFHSFPDTFVCN